MGGITKKIWKGIIFIDPQITIAQNGYRDHVMRIVSIQHKNSQLRIKKYLDKFCIKRQTALLFSFYSIVMTKSTLIQCLYRHIRHIHLT